MSYVTCKHKNYPDILYVANSPTKKRDSILLTGSKKAAYNLDAGTAQNIRDDLLQTHRDVVLHRS